MRLRHYFLPTTKETPAEAQIPSHRLMLRAGLVRQGAAGIYSWLPIGLKVLRKIEQIVREEQNFAGGQEMLMSTIQSADVWRETGRYDSYGKEMLRIEDRHGREMVYGPTNEDMITDLFRRDVRSYRDLPIMLYHVQWKFRDEIRPRFGVMRGREFLMKDAYSFDVSPEEARKSYYAQFCAYLRTFARMGLKAIPMRADTGPIGGDLSHEFVILADTGESEVFYERAFENLDPMALNSRQRETAEDQARPWTTPYAATDEIHDPADCPVADSDLVTGRGIEVGHIFYFGDKYSAPMNATVQLGDGTTVPVEMGSYGVGVSRLVGAVIEASHDEHGIIWPEAIAPFKLGLINLKVSDEQCCAVADELYRTLTMSGVDVLYDDRDERAGTKFATMDLIGLPYQAAIGPRGLEKGVFEVKNRATGERSEMTMDALVEWLTE